MDSLSTFGALSKGAYMCKVNGTVGKISDCKPEGLGFNSPPWSRVELWETFFRHTVRGQGRLAIGLVSQHSIAGLKRNHTLVDKSRLMPVLWTVTFSATKGARTRKDYVSYCQCSR